MLHNNFFSLIFFLFSINAYGFTDFSKTDFKFLTASQSSEFLSTSDDFILQSTPLDFSLHHSSAQTISITEQLEYLKHVSLDWNLLEIARISDEIAEMKRLVNILDLSLNLPKIIFLIKTNGNDEFNAHYTRGNAIIFPIKNMTEGVTTLSPTLFHELFHIMSRHNPELMDKIYAVCNFKKIPRVVIPKSLQDIALTNPDAFYYQHSLTVTANGKEIEIIPFFYSAIKQTEINGPVDEAKTFKLGLLDLNTINDEIPKLYKVSETDYKSRALVNTSYYIHPEEIMAENFRLLLMKTADINSIPAVKFPMILDELALILK